MRGNILALVDRYCFGGYDIIHNTSRGRQVLVRCPFHKEGREKTPSFHWNIDNGLFICFSCHVKGALHDFLRMVGLSKGDITEIIEAHRANDKIRKLTASAFRRAPNPLKDNPVLPESILGLFDHTPIALLNQGFEADVLERYNIGYDYPRKRITFPIRDVFGRLIGVSGRKDGDFFGPRYKMYSEEEWKEVYPGYVLQKSMTLWNAHNLWSEHVTHYVTRPWETVTILVEGFKAALWLIQHGYEDTVALMGSMISEVQTYILSMIGGRVIVFLDNDTAGRKGTREVVKTLRLKSASTPYAVKYPEGYDDAAPDDLDGVIIDQLIMEAM